MTIGCFPDYEAFIVIPSSAQSLHFSDKPVLIHGLWIFMLSLLFYFSMTNNLIENVSTSTPIASLLIYRWGSGIRLEIIVLSYSSVVE